MLIAATLILRGTAPSQLGCPIVDIARSPQQIHARIIRLPMEDSSYAEPAKAFSVTFFGLAADTYSVRVWASNAAGPGCDTVVRRTAYITTDAPLPRPRPEYFDLQGRRIHPPFRRGQRIFIRHPRHDL